MNPRHPVYVISKGRWKARLTHRILTRMKVPHRMVVEEQEFADYAAVIDPSMLLVLPQRYIEEYDPCDNLGATKSKGSGAARNFVWDHSTSEGHRWHWLLDDNIEAFYRLNRNMKLVADTGAIFRAAEDFVERYENIAIAGMNYDKFCKSVDRVPPYVLNTRIYSCLLIRNDIPYRWRCRFNEDTDLSLRVLKDGWATCQFNAFLAGKVTTQRMRGGNKDELYSEGTKAKSQMLVDLHPDVAEMVWKFNRWHHKVDYKPFKGTKLVRKAGLVVPNKVNEYGMVMVDIAPTEEANYPQHTEEEEDDE